MKALRVLIASTALLFQVSVAKADLLFNWSYTDGGANLGSGTLTAELDPFPNAPANAYLVTSVNGVMNGLQVSNVVDTTFVVPSQLIYFGPGTTAVVDAQGISFSNFVSIAQTPNALAYNLAADGAVGGSPFPGFTCGGASYCLVGPGPYNDANGTNLDPVSGDRIYSVVPLTEVLITLASPVPEPATWAMMVLGFAGVGATTYRRRKAAAVAA